MMTPLTEAVRRDLALRDYPLETIRETVDQLIAQGCTCLQRFSCRACGLRQTIDEPNTFYHHGKCGRCGCITNLRSTGCGFALIWSRKDRQP